MKYTGNLCQGCGQPFADGDDIVVCPECGTPQHRECYDKENRCVCAHLHGEEYAWQGTVKNEEPRSTEKSETVSCPNCGYENPKGTDVCKQCGMKFTFFGMNVVDALHEEEKRAANSNSDIPDYKPPFTLGTGIGFDRDAENESTPSPEQVQELITNVLSGSSENNTHSEERLNLGGPFPPTDEIDGVITNNIGNFIGTNGMTYISKFRKIQNGKKLSFNFASFFFAPYWFFFRKLYKVGIAVMTALLAVNILATPYVYKLLEVYEKLLPALQSGTMTEAQFNGIYTELVTASTPMFIYFSVIVLIHLICGFVSDHLYKRYVIAHARVAERCGNKATAMGYIVRNGGASVLIAGISYIAHQLLTMIASSMM